MENIEKLFPETNRKKGDCKKCNPAEIKTLPVSDAEFRKE